MWFLNLTMLFGLGGVLLPVVAHLLSKKRYEVERWGAMQFLELGRNTQRRVRLEEFWLMVLRMGVIGLIALAMARPWFYSQWLGWISSTTTRDVVVVLDGSSSMGWEQKSTTPQAFAVQRTHELLESLRGGDTVALLDAREAIRPLVTPATTDLRQIRLALNSIPAPAGSCDLIEATAQGLRILNTGSNLARDVIVFTDLQARAWLPEDEVRWETLDELRAQPAISPRIWVVDVGPDVGPVRENFSIDNIKLSRTFTSVEMPVRIRTKLKHHAGTAAATRKVFLEINGIRISDATLQSASLAPGSEFTVEFEHRFAKPGLHLISVVTEADNLPEDNRSDAVIEVSPSLPILIVNGAPHADPTRDETFFLQIALGRDESRTSLIQTRIVNLEGFTKDTLDNRQVVVLANVSRLSDSQVSALQAFVDAGGGAVIALGDRVQSGFYNESLFRGGQGVLPVTLEEIVTSGLVDGKDGSAVHVENRSLELPWLQAFRKEHQGGFTETRFDKWWRVTVPAPAKQNDTRSKNGSTNSETSFTTGPLISARLNNSAPFLIEHRFGQGHVLLLTAPLDADWSSLPTKPDYVPFVHELIFHLTASSRPSRNVQSGEPLQVVVGKDFEPGDYIFRGPGTVTIPAVPSGNELQRFARLDDTSIPGIYRLEAAGDSAPARVRQGVPSVVNPDRTESDLKPLSAEQRQKLQGKERLKIVKNLQELRSLMMTDTSTTEIWHFLFLVVLGLLVVEVWLTRRLVQGGHEVLEDE